ncbi:hypothetical protein [Bartonella vinsonii]|uniref:hypothetical protein n=1 Tax=Bartonella vinsonii TaxID=33047 RepID=UPI000309EA1C|nr:hypothetical protein [Bartonella vinsonii]
MGRVFEGAVVLPCCWNCSCFCWCGGKAFGCFVGDVFDGGRISCIARAVFSLADKEATGGAPGWGGVAVFVDFEVGGVLLHCWRVCIFYA